jgi:hypothetical protein
MKSLRWVAEKGFWARPKQPLGTLVAAAIVALPQLGLGMEPLHSLQNLLFAGIAVPELEH